MKWQHTVWNIPKSRLPAIVDRAVWQKVEKGQARIPWESEVEKVWTYIGRNQKKLMSARTFGRYMAHVEEMTERRGRLALRDKVESEKHFEILYAGD